MALTERVRRWQERGEREHFRGHGIHVFRRPGEGPLLLFLHGFPSSSYDWRGLLDELPDRAALAFDFLGFGLSDKPRGHRYGLGWQADLTTELVRRHGDGRPVFLIGHDMGTSVATELMARDLEGTLGWELSGVLLFNGSIVLEAASLTLAQKLLRGPLGPLAARLSSRRFFDHQFGALFSAGHPLDPAEAEDQWALICHASGRTIGHRLVHYLDERVSWRRAGTVRSATGSRSGSPGACRTRSRRPPSSRPSASFTPACPSPSCPSSAITRRSRTRHGWQRSSRPANNLPPWTSWKRFTSGV